MDARQYSVLHLIEEGFAASMQRSSDLGASIDQTLVVRICDFDLQ